MKWHVGPRCGGWHPEPVKGLDIKAKKMSIISTCHFANGKFQGKPLLRNASIRLQGYYRYTVCVQSIGPVPKELYHVFVRIIHCTVTVILYMVPVSMYRLGIYRHFREKGVMGGIYTRYAWVTWFWNLESFSQGWHILGLCSQYCLVLRIKISHS